MARIPPLFDDIVRFALPPRCPVCGVTVAQDHQFCLACWQQLEFLQPPWCGRCGQPFAFAAAADTVCLSCLKHPPRHDGVRAVVAYDKNSGAVAMRLKYGGRLGMATLIARHLARHLPEMPDDALIIPVPLHRWRLWSRGYNQSVLIGRALAALGPQQLVLDLLHRCRRTPPLRGMTARQRHQTVRQAFTLGRRSASLLAGRTIILVDDVYTSGATANACAAVLKKGGAARVYLFCWARALREDRLQA